MFATWQRLDRTQQRRIGAAISVTLLVLTVIVGTARAGAIEGFATGVWTCAGNYTDTLDPRDVSTREQREDLPAPFDRLGPFEVRSVETWPVLEPESRDLENDASFQVVISPDGRFLQSGSRAFETLSNTGTWTREDGLFVIRFDDEEQRTHAFDVRRGQDGTDILTWDGDDNRYFELYEMQIEDVDRSVRLTFSTRFGGYQANCSKTSDDTSLYIY